MAWWDTLDADFWRQRDRFELGPKDRAQVSLTAAFDVVIRTIGATFVGTTALPFGFSPGRLRRIEEEGAFYADFAERQDAHGFFAPPTAEVAVEQRNPGFLHFHPRGGRCQDLRFESPFVARHPSAAPRLSRGQNRFAHARYWWHQRGPRPTIIAIHGFSADVYALNEWLFALPWFYELGCDVLLFTLPHHGQRKNATSPFSGHGFFSGGISGVNEAFAQAVHDFRLFYRFLQRHRAVEQIGVTGVSLGGYTAALLACLEPGLAFSVPNVPLVSITDVALEWHPIGEFMRAAMALTGVSVQALRRMLAVSSPLTYPPALPRERLMIIGGIADRLAPPKHSRLLWEHWQRCRLHWFPGSHVLHLDRGAYLKETARFFASLGFIAEKRRSAGNK